MKLPPHVHRLLPAISLALALSAVPAAALGHVALATSTPEAGTILATAPTEVTLTFDGELDPAGSTFTVRDDDSDEVGTGQVDLTVAERNVMTGRVHISEPDVYTVEWQVLGTDGHETRGAFSFSYAAGDDGHDSPDTAVAPGTVDPLALAGMALLVLAATAVGRRILVR